MSMICFKSKVIWGIYMSKHVFMNVFNKCIFFYPEPYYRCPNTSVISNSYTSCQKSPASPGPILSVLSNLEASLSVF